MYSWVKQIGNFLGVNSSSSNSRSRENSQSAVNHHHYDPTSSSSYVSPSSIYSGSHQPPEAELFFLPNEPKIGILRLNPNALFLQQESILSESAQNNGNNNNNGESKNYSSVADIVRHIVHEAIQREEEMAKIKKRTRSNNNSNGQNNSAPENETIVIDCVMNCFSSSSRKSSSLPLSIDEDFVMDIFGLPCVSVPRVVTTSATKNNNHTKDGNDKSNHNPEDSKILCQSDDQDELGLDSLRWVTFFSALLSQYLHTAASNDYAVNKNNNGKSKDLNEPSSTSSSSSDGEEEQQRQTPSKEDHRIILVTTIESPNLAEFIDYSLLALSSFFLFEGKVGWAETGETVLETVVKAANNSSNASFHHFPIRPSLRRSRCHLHLLNRFRLLFVMPTFPVCAVNNNNGENNNNTSNSSTSLLQMKQIDIQFVHNALSSMMSMMMANDEEFTFAPANFWLSVDNINNNDLVNVGNFYQLLQQVQNSSSKNENNSSSSFSLSFVPREVDNCDAATTKSLLLLSGDSVVSLYYHYDIPTTNRKDNSSSPSLIKKKEKSRLIFRTVFSTFFVTSSSLNIRNEFDSEPTEWAFPDQQFYNNSAFSSKSQPAALQFLQVNHITFQFDENVKKNISENMAVESSFSSSTSSLTSTQKNGDDDDSAKINLVKEKIKLDQEGMNTLLETAQRSPLYKVLSSDNFELITKRALQNPQQTPNSPLQIRRRKFQQIKASQNQNVGKNKMYYDDDDDNLDCYHDEDEENDQDDYGDEFSPNPRISRSKSKTHTNKESSPVFSLTNDYFFLGVPVFDHNNNPENDNNKQRKVEKKNPGTNSHHHGKNNKDTSSHQKNNHKRPSIVSDFVLARRYAEPQLAMALDEFAKLNQLKKMSFRFTRRGVAEASIETEEDLLAMIRQEYDERQRTEEDENFVAAADDDIVVVVDQKEEQEKKKESRQKVEPVPQVVVVETTQVDPAKNNNVVTPACETEKPNVVVDKTPTATIVAAVTSAPPSNPLFAELLARRKPAGDNNNNVTTSANPAIAVPPPKPAPKVNPLFGGGGGGMANLFAELKAKTGNKQQAEESQGEKKIMVEEPKKETITATTTTTTTNDGKFRPPKKGPPPRADGKMPPCPMRDYFPEGKSSSNSSKSVVNDNGNSGNPLAAAAAAIAAMRNKQMAMTGNNNGVSSNKPKIPDGPKLKTFFWKKLKLKAKVGVWVDDGIETNNNINQVQISASATATTLSSSSLSSAQEELLKTLFLVKPPEPKLQEAIGGELDEKSKAARLLAGKKKSTALSGQRQQAVGIVLKKLKLTSPQLFCEKLLECSEDLVHGDVIDAVYRAMPLPDEAKNLKIENEKRDLYIWGDAEEALFAISQKVPDAKERLALVKSISDVQSLLETTRKQFQSISQLVPNVIPTSSSSSSETNTNEKKSENGIREKETNEISSSCPPTHQSLAKILRLILSIGNFLNKGTAHGSAIGFSLETLGALTMMKSVDGKSNLMDAVVELFYKESQQQPSISFSGDDDFSEKLLKLLVSASAVPLSQLALNVAEMGRTMQRVKRVSLNNNNNNNNNNNSANQIVDKLPQVAKQAYEKYSAKVAAIMIQEQNVREEMIALIEYFGDQSLISNSNNNSNDATNNNNATIDEVTLFTCLKSFCREWIKSRGIFFDKEQKKKLKLLQQEQEQQQIDEQQQKPKTVSSRPSTPVVGQQFQDHGAILKKVQEKRKAGEEEDW